MSLYCLKIQNLKKYINILQNFNREGYVLSLANVDGIDDLNEEIEDLFSSQFLLYDIRSINGYSPVGNKNISKLLVTWSFHGFFDNKKTINNLSQMCGNKCYFDLLNITSIILKRDRILENLNIETK